MTASNGDPFNDYARLFRAAMGPSDTPPCAAPTAKPSDDAATLEAKGLKIVDPGYELVAKVLREKIDEVNALLAIAAKIGLSVEFQGIRGSEPPKHADELYRTLLGGAFGRAPRTATRLEATITRTERL